MLGDAHNILLPYIWGGVALTGLLLGSFASALTFRIPNAVPWWGRARSQCSHCKNTLTPYDLIPLFSWLLQGGKCRHCKTAISPQYPIIEMLSLLACLAIFSVHGLSVETFFMVMLVPFLLALFFIDLKYKILPDQLNLIAFSIGVVFVATKASLNADYAMLSPHMIGAAVFSIGMWLIGKIMSLALKKEALGFGDVKFFAVAGLWLGISGLAPFLLLSGVFGVVLGGLWQGVKKEKTFPFGPALIAAFFTLLLIDASKWL